MAKRLEGRIAALEAKHSRQGQDDTWQKLIPHLQVDELVVLLAHLERVADGEPPSPEIVTIVETAAAREGIDLSGS